MASSDQQAMPDSPSTSKGLTRHVQRYESGDLALSPTAHIAALQATADRLDGELARYRSGGGARAHKGGAQDKEAKKIERCADLTSPMRARGRLLEAPTRG